MFWLSDEAWNALSPHLPRGTPGKPRVDDRTVISGILHVLKTGCRWSDVPPVYGRPTTIFNRYNRWSQRHVWQRIFEEMARGWPHSRRAFDRQQPCQSTPRGERLKKREFAEAIDRSRAEGRARSILRPMIARDRSHSR